MEVQLRQVIGAFPALQRLQRERLSAPIAFRLAKLVRKLEQEGKAFESTRMQILQRFRGEGEEIPPEQQQEAIAELDGLLDETVEVDLPRIAIEDLGRAEITTADALALEWLFTEGGEM
jgi:hypothetical protein